MENVIFSIIMILLNACIFLIEKDLLWLKFLTLLAIETMAFKYGVFSSVLNDFEIDHKSYLKIEKTVLLDAINNRYQIDTIAVSYETQEIMDINYKRSK